jgi:hypothetical protein
LTLFLRFFFCSFLAHSLELEVSLEIETDIDSDSKLRFEGCGNVDGVILRMEEGSGVASPTRLLVFRPASLLQLLCEKAVRGGSVLAIVSNVDGVEVVWQEVSGHDAIVCAVLCSESCLT